MRPVSPDVQVRQVRQALAVATPRVTTALLSAIEAAHDPRARTEGSRRTRGASESAQPPPNLEAAEIANLESILVPLMDPMIALGEVQSRTRNQRLESQETEAADNSDRAQIAEAERQQQLEKARKALAKKMRGMPRWLKGIVAAVVAAIGAVASVVTGGASVVLASVALAFMFAGDVLTALVNRGVLPAKPTSYIALGMKVVGAVLSTIASLGTSAAGSAASVAGSAASAVADAVKLANTIAQIVGGLSEIADGSITINNAVREFRANMAQAEAELQAALRDEAGEEIEDAIQDMRGIHQSFTRVIQRLRLAVEASGDSGRAVATA